MRLSSLAALALIAGASSPTYVSIALAAPECSRSMELADWGENSTGDINLASGDSCIFLITLRGATSSSEISQKPAHGKLKKINVATYEYKTKARYKGSDTFVIKATGKGPKASGTSVITARDDQVGWSSRAPGRCGRCLVMWVELKSSVHLPDRRDCPKPEAAPTS